MSGRTLGERAFIGMQYLLPQHCCRARRLDRRSRDRLRARGPDPRFPVRTTRSISRKRRSPTPDRYSSFNDFFTRRLRAGARSFDADPRAALCPADGIVSQAGRIAGDTLVQAKGIDYSAAALLGGDAALAAEFAGGDFATHLPRAPQLSPRAHAARRHAAHRAIRAGRPVQRQCRDGAQRAGPVRAQRAHRLRLRHGGRTAGRRAGRRALRRQHEPRLGRADPARDGPRTPRDLPCRDPIIALDRGAELGWFNMGSTVVVLFAPQGPALVDGLARRPRGARRRAARRCRDERRRTGGRRRRSRSCAGGRPCWRASAPTSPRRTCVEVQTPVLSRRRGERSRRSNRSRRRRARRRGYSCRPRPSTR